ncbi:MAG TPA: hypothetical protein VNO30_07215 [Kofleriaceae bacterium]|nr:hypothetical protein [Kofleriaceae bacterium]
MFRKIIPALMFAALAGGCFSSGRAEYGASVTVSSEAPDLAYVAPGVHVIADYEEPIFYSNGFYWYSVDGIWYRSATYTGGWVQIGTPPVAIARIRSPYAYRYYRPSSYVAHRRPVPASRVQRPVVRERHVRESGVRGAYIREHRR